MKTKTFIWYDGKEHIQSHFDKKTGEIVLEEKYDRIRHSFKTDREHCEKQQAIYTVIEDFLHLCLIVMLSLVPWMWVLWTKILVGWCVS